MKILHYLKNIYVQIFILSILILAIYYPILMGIYAKVSTNEDYSHAFLMPFIAAYLIWEKRKSFKNAQIRPFWIGILLVIFTLLFSIYGVLGSDISAARISWWLWLVCIVLFCYGLYFFKILFLPILMLGFIIPLPNCVQAPLTMSLKLASSKLAAFIIRIANIPVYLDGNILDLGYTQLQVVDACSGLRYILPLIALGILCAYFFQKSLWKRIILVFLTLPIAVLMNGLRVSLTAILSQWVSPKAAEGFFHSFSGWLVFLLSFSLLMVLSYILKLLPPKDVKKRQNVSHLYSNSAKTHYKRKERGNIIPFTITVGLLVVILVASLSTSTMPKIKLANSMAAFPLEFKGWKGTPGSIDPKILKKSGAEEAFQATYINDKNEIVSIYIGYRGTPFMEGEEFFHSPTVCLPSSGWKVLKQEKHTIPDASPHYKEFVVRKMLVEKMGQRQLVYFWFQTKTKIAHIIFQNRFHLAMHALRRDNTYDLTVHVYTPIDENERTA
ncbi:MAG: EpsI family protein, partial [Candidatus Omnitrophota bacterium]